MILSRDLKFSRRLKSGLDETRRVSAITFTSPDNALAHLQSSPQDVVILDADQFDYDIRIVYEKLIEEQAELGFLILSNQKNIVQDHPTRRLLQRDTRVRDMLPILESIATAIKADLTDTAPNSSASTATDPRVTPDVRIDEDFTPLPRSLPETGDPLTVPPADAIFQKLSQEEPPLPDDATVSDLQQALFAQQDVTEFESTPTPMASQEADGASQPTPASLILESTSGDTTPLDQLAIETFVRNLEDKLAGLVHPLPSWEGTSDHANREPTFLTFIDTDEEPLEYTSQTTLPSKATRAETDEQYTDTELQVPIQRSHPVDEDDKADHAPDPSHIIDQDTDNQTDLNGVVETTFDHDLTVADARADEEATQLDDIDSFMPNDLMTDDRFIEEDDPLIMSQPMAPILLEGFDDNDSQLVQIASVITQMSLETAASATALLWGQQIIAVAGDMPRSDIDELFEQEPRLLEPTNLPQKMFFVTLNSSGMNYMVMLMPTVDELLLVLIFSGNQPLSTIRRQTSRLIAALANVPDAIKSSPVDAIESAIPTKSTSVTESVDSPVLNDAVIQDDRAEVATEDLPTTQQPDIVTPQKPLVPERDWGKRQSYTFVWVLKDTRNTLTSLIGESLAQGLDTTYSHQGWQIAKINVHEDYIQLQADVPGEMPPHHYVYDLMRSSATILQSDVIDEGDNPSLWSDSYMVLSPARELDTTEIQRFLNFVRD